jgi:hypothetical protein
MLLRPSPSLSLAVYVGVVAGSPLYEQMVAGTERAKEIICQW